MSSVMLQSLQMRQPSHAPVSAFMKPPVESPAEALATFCDGRTGRTRWRQGRQVRRDFCDGGADGRYKARRVLEVCEAD